MKQKAPKKTMNGRVDPDPYDGLIRRADGVRPYNHYLWPTESWWASHRIHSRWHFGIVALADGRFSTEGCVYSIEKNDDFGKPCVFSTRTKALRTAAARMIRIARHSKNWDGLSHGGLKGNMLAEVINWTRNVVALETGKPVPKPVYIQEPLPVYRETGLPLFDFHRA